MLCLCVSVCRNSFVTFLQSDLARSSPADEAGALPCLLSDLGLLCILLPLCLSGCAGEAAKFRLPSGAAPGKHEEETRSCPNPSRLVQAWRDELRAALGEVICPVLGGNDTQTLSNVRGCSDGEGYCLWAIVLVYLHGWGQGDRPQVWQDPHPKRPTSVCSMRAGLWEERNMGTVASWSLLPMWEESQRVKV